MKIVWDKELIEHTGDDCPVSDDTIVLCFFSDGSFELGRADMTGCWHCENHPQFRVKYYTVITKEDMEIIP